MLAVPASSDSTTAKTCPGLAADSARPMRPVFFGSPSVSRVRLDGETGDVARVVEPEVREGPAAVGRFVDTVAPGRGVAAVPFAGADVDDLRIARGDGHAADGQDRLVVEDRAERRAAVRGLEQPAGPGADEELGRLARNQGDLADPPPHVG